MIITEQWLQNHLNSKKIAGIVKDKADHIVCMNGARLSVQAGQNWYSIPRNDDGPYTHVEYCYAVDPIETVYGYVPIEKVVSIINEFGGIDTSQ